MNIYLNFVERKNVIYSIQKDNFSLTYGLSEVPAGKIINQCQKYQVFSNDPITMYTCQNDIKLQYKHCNTEDKLIIFFYNM